MDEFKKRFSAARAIRRAQIEDKAREVYKFCFNGRETEWDEKTKTDDDAEEVFTDIVASIAEEFSGDLFSTMTPENAPWVGYESAGAVEDEKVALEELQAFEAKIDKALHTSNYYDEGPTAFNDAVVGTIALWGDREELNAPISWRALPISHCYLRLGPYGIDDRFYRESYYYSDLQALFPNAKWPRELQDKIKNAKMGQAKVVWGFWKTYKDPANPIWRQEIRVDDKAIGLDEDLEGDGSCPMIVGRFNPMPKSPWGRGPGIRMLPTLRVLDEIVRMNMEGMDRQLDPAFVYPHDGILDLSQGIEAGIGYPAMPGSAESVQPLGLFGNLDYGFFSEERIEQIVRDGFYRDNVQKGKTPPSASQYLGDTQKNRQRMARPAKKTWRELGVGVLQRTEYLEKRSGGSLVGAPDMPGILGGSIIARPISPLERAQSHEDVLIAQSVMSMANEGLGPEQAGVLIDGPKTMRKIKEALKDRIVEFRTEDQLKKMMADMQQGAANAGQA